MDAWLAALPEITVVDGAELLTEGQPTTRMYVTVSGTLHVLRQGLQVDVVDQPGIFFGEMAALLGGAPRATVVASGPCTLRYTEDARELMQREPAVAIGVAETVARRLDIITGYLSDLRVQYADRSDHLSVVTHVLQALMRSHGTTVEPGSEREPEAPY